jgi:hypothetical protein
MPYQATNRVRSAKFNNQFRLLFAFALGFLGLILLFAPQKTVHAATFDVPNGDITALTNAINTANSNGVDDVINLAAGGTYDFTSPTAQSLCDGGTVLPDVTTTITINGNGATFNVANPEADLRFFCVDGGNLTVNNLTMQEGFQSEAEGGAIHSAQATVTLNSVTFRNNRALEGGAIFVGGSTLNIDRSLFIQNQLSSEDCPCSLGGAIDAISSTATISNSLFDGNSSGTANGGAIGFTGSTASINRTTFTNNSANIGGAIYFGTLVQSNNNISISNSTFYSNTANSFLEFESIEFPGFGGSLAFEIIDLVTTTININHSTFYQNKALGLESGGGAIAMINISNATTFNLQNSLIVSNTASNPGEANCSILDEGTVTGNTANTLVQPVSDPCLTATTTNTNPLSPNILAANGGATVGAGNGTPMLTVALPIGSQAINFTGTACVGAPVNGVDQRGVARDTNCDAGAFEVNNPKYASNPVPGSTINIGMGTIGVPLVSTLVISNTGTSNLQVSAPVGLSGVFTIDATTAFSLTPSGSRAVTLTCIPQAVTSYSVTLSYTTNESGAPTYTYTLQCAGTPPPQASSYKFITPARLYDSRPSGTSNPNPPFGVSSGKFNPNEIRIIKAFGQFGIPNSAVAILASVQIDGAEGGGFLSVFPANLPDSNTASVNWYQSPTPGARTVNNFVFIPLSATGDFKVKSGGGRGHVIIDVFGYLDTSFTNGNIYKPVTAVNTRLYDSRPATTNTPPALLGAGTGKMVRGNASGTNIRTINVNGQLGIPANASAVIVNVTASETVAGGYFALYPTAGTVPFVANVNWNDRTLPNTNIPRDVANMAVVPLNNGQFDVTIGGNRPEAAAHLVIDVIGYLEPAIAPNVGFHILLSSQLRLYDSRSNEPNFPGSNLKGALAPGQTRTITARGVLGVPANAKQIVVRVTIVNATGGGFLTLYPGTSVPNSSNVNTTGTSQTTANIAVVNINADGTITVRNGHPTSNLGFVLDVVGYLT